MLLFQFFFSICAPVFISFRSFVCLFACFLSSYCSCSWFFALFLFFLFFFLCSFASNIFFCSCVYLFFSFFLYFKIQSISLLFTNLVPITIYQPFFFNYKGTKWMELISLTYSTLKTIIIAIIIKYNKKKLVNSFC